MKLEDELRILSGIKDAVFERDPLDIPCIETSDAEKLCRNPVVSVQMLAYNHEPYIRQAIESVVSQKTDFEFELVIGEDCSKDRTREICFEYQKLHPDKIRVLWAEQNVWNLGGNGPRCRARCRGQYIAYCEGDDYWTDQYRLQKQVDLARKHDAGLCVAKTVKLFPDGREEPDSFEFPEVLDPTVFVKHYLHTSTYLMRRDVYEKARELYRKMGTQWWDTITFFCISSLAPVVFLDDFVSVRRITGTGMATSLSRRKLCELKLRQYLMLYRHGPRGSIRHHFAQVVLEQVRRLVLFTDTESMAWLRPRRGYLFRLHIGISLHELPHAGFRGAWQLCNFIRFAVPGFFGLASRHGAPDAPRGY